MKILFALALLLNSRTAIAYSNGMNEKECKASAGRVVSNFPPECRDDEISLGPVRMKCPCSCCAPAKQARSATQSPLEALREIRPADKKAFGQIRDARDWRNPRIIVSDPDILIVDRALVTAPELISKLAKLPKDAWPYGRIVLIMKGSIGSKGTGPKAKENYYKVLMILKEANIQADQWPSA